MSTKKPDPQDFGITPEEYALYRSNGTSSYLDPSCLTSLLIPLVTFLVIVSIVFIVTRDLGVALPWGIGGGIFLLWATIIVTQLVDSTIVRFKRSRLLASPVAAQIKLYEEAQTAYRVIQEETERARREAEQAQREAERVRREAERAQWKAERARRRKLSDHWMSLGGPEFERELGTLYRHLGYRVESTPSSGDGGIDLVLRKNGKTTVVQCKSHQAPVGPAIARELLGSLVASGADDAILACTGGFTQGVRKFVRGKPITLISASELAALGESVEDRTQDRASGPPGCPVPGCGKTMVSRMGKYGRFWGCPEYPKCRGTRDDPEGLA